MTKIIIDVREYENLKSEAARAPRREVYREPEHGSCEWAWERAEECGGQAYYAGGGEWNYDIDSEGQD